MHTCRHCNGTGFEVNELTMEEAAKSMQEVAKDLLNDLDPLQKRSVAYTRSVRNDAKDLRSIADFLLMGDLQKAGKKARHLDTIVRELIPDDVWYLLETVNG